MPNIEWGGGGRHWTEINASVPKKFVHDCLNPIFAKVVPEKAMYARE